MSRERPPERLRGIVARDLAPVRPLSRPALRALWLVPLGALVWWILYRQGVRPDAGQLGALMLWGPSVLQALAGLVVLTLALREAVPGRSLDRRSLVLGGAALAAWLASVTWATWLRSPREAPPDLAGFFWRYCTGWSLVAALPLIALALFLVRRAFPTRPALAGALCGLGAGLIVDGSWRTYCSVSAPGHILESHMLGLLVATLIGALLGALVGRRR